MLMNRIVEYAFFFGFLGVVGYLVWEIISPFVSALALAAIIVTICYPLYLRIVEKMPKKNPSAGALVTTILVLLVVIMPLLFLTSAIVSEALTIYQMVNKDQVLFAGTLQTLETTVQGVIPAFELNTAEYMRQAAAWFAGNIGAIFAGTASTIFLFFIAMIGAFYFFRDGREFTKRLVVISPLPDDEDELILRRLALAVRSVATGIVLVALIQGTLTALGLTIVGIERAVLLGAIAAIGALIPSVGTSIVFIPTVAYLIISGEYVNAVILTVWGLTFVGLIDNLLGPWLMSRGNALHPFLVLLAVLGGITVFGPIGFIVGPVVVSLFLVLIELYSQHIARNTEAAEQLHP